MPSLREDNESKEEEEEREACNNNDAKLSVNDEEEENTIVDSQLTVKTDNTSKNEDDNDDVVDSQLTVKTDNTSKVNEDEDTKGLLDQSHNNGNKEDGHDDMKDMELNLSNDDNGTRRDDDKEGRSDNDNDVADEVEERSPKYETAREESNDSFPNSSQMLTPLEPLALSSQPSTSSSAVLSPLLTTQMSQQQQQQQQQEQQDILLNTQVEPTATEASSLLLTQVTSGGGGNFLGSTQASLNTAQMTQERQQQEEQDQVNSQATTSSELQLGLTQSQRTTNTKEQGESQQHHDHDEREKSPELFVDATDEDFIEKFASKMNEKKDDGDDEVEEVNEFDDTEGKDGEDNNDGSMEEKDTKHTGTDGENMGMFVETNDSDGENDNENIGAGLLTQAVDDDDDDDSMSDVNSVKTQESKGAPASSDDGDDNEVVVDIIQEQGIVVNVQSNISDKDGHHPLSGLTGPSQSQSDMPVQPQSDMALSQRSSSNKHVSFREDRQDKLGGEEKASKLDMDAAGIGKEEGDDADKKDTIETIDTKESSPQLDLKKDEEEEEESTILNREKGAIDDGRMNDANDESKHSSDEEEEAKVLKAKNISADTENHDESQQALSIPEQPYGGDNTANATADDVVENDDLQETGDTIVTTGSGSIGWSLYDGETQQLLSVPSQILPGPSSPQKDSESANDEDDVEMNDVEVAVIATAGNKDDDIVKMNVDEAVDGVGGVDEYNENELTQPLVKTKSKDDDVDANDKKDELDNGDDERLVEMKHTQENGLPSALSYPDDHIEKDQSPVKASNLAHAQNDHESQTQQSQD
eukprot:scaffold7524_cov141-Skeletonema_menzelii.AAC.1